MGTCEPVPRDPNVVYYTLRTDKAPPALPLRMKKSAYERANPNQPFYAAITGKKSKRGKK